MIPRARVLSSIHELLKQHSTLIVHVALTIVVAGILYWRLVRGYVPVFTLAPFEAPPGWVQMLYSWRWAARLFIILALAALAYVELANQALSRWLHQALENRRGLIGLIGACGLLLGSYYLQVGNMGAGDATPHIGAVWVLGEAIKDGQWLPFWTNYGYLGNPFLQFYSPLYYYFVLLINSLVQNFNTAAEVTLLVLHMLSAYAMCLFVQQLTGSKVAGFVASLAWSATFYHYNTAIAQGKLPTAMFVYLWPLQLYLIERLIQNREKSLRWGAALTLTVGAMLWSHMLYGGLAIAFGALYTLLRSLAAPPGTIRQTLGNFLPPLVAQICGVLTALYYVIPVFAERQYVVGVPLDFTFLMPTIGVESVLDFPGAYPSSWFGGFIGNTIMTISALAIILIVVARYNQGLPLLIYLSLAAFFVFTPYYAPAVFDAIFKNVPLGVLAYSIKSAGSYLIFFIGPLAALVGVCCHLTFELIQQSKARAAWAKILPTSDRIGVILGAILLVELVPITMRANYKYPDDYLGSSQGRQPIVEMLAHSTDLRSRVMDVNRSIENMFFISMHTGHPGLVGHTPDTPKPSGIVVEELFPLAAKDTAAGRLQPNTAILLYQFDVGYLITESSIDKVDGLEEALRTGTSVLWALPYHAPIVAASTLEAGNWIKVSYPQGGDVPVSIINYSPTATKVLLEFSLPQRAFVQLAYTAYPYQRVLLDEQPITVTATRLGLIGFWAEAGSHTVWVAPELSPLRQWTLVVSVIVVMAALVLAILPIRLQSK